MPNTLVHIGPYARWLVPQDNWFARVGSGREAAWIAEVFDGTALAWVGIEWPAVVVAGQQFRPFYGLPREARPGAPQRPMLLETGLGGYFQPPWATDWLGLDPEIEVLWFRSAFATELARAAEVFCGAPTFHWGLLIEHRS